MRVAGVGELEALLAAVGGERPRSRARRERRQTVVVRSPSSSITRMRIFSSGIRCPPSRSRARTVFVRPRTNPIGQRTQKDCDCRDDGRGQYTCGERDVEARRRTMKGYGPTDANAAAALRRRHHVPAAAARHAVSTAWTSRSSACPSTPASPCAPGARFGPRAVREASLTIRPAYNPAQRVAVFERLSVVDAGDVRRGRRGFTDRSLDAMEATLRAGARGRRRAARASAATTRVAARRAARRGRHARPARPASSSTRTRDTWTRASASGTRTARSCAAPRRRASIDAARSTLLGMRGGLDGPGRARAGARAGLHRGPVGRPRAARHRRGGGGRRARRRARRSSPSTSTSSTRRSRPAAGTPECGGPTSMQALALLRACRGLRPRGRRRRRGLPDLDSSHLTATLAATIACELLS